MIEYVGVFKSLLSIFDWFKNIFTKKNTDLDIPEETIADRFIMLFESHGVHRNQIPRFFKHGLTIESVQDNEKLIKVLTEDALKDACELFAVRHEWLDGADAKVYEKKRFYRSPEKFINFLDGLLNKPKPIDVDASLLVSGGGNSEGSAIIIFQERIGQVEDLPVFRFYISEHMHYHSWKYRTYLAAYIASAWKRDISIDGKTISAEEMKQLVSCETILGLKGEGLSKFWMGTDWYPEDLSLDPSIFLEGIKSNYDRIAALQLWLKLEEQGFMDSGLEKEGVREAFEKQLEIENQ